MSSGSAISGLTIGQAVEQLGEEGRICRPGWRRHGIYLFKSSSGTLMQHMSSGTISEWNPFASDITANDWMDCS